MLHYKLQNQTCQCAVLKNNYLTKLRETLEKLTQTLQFLNCSDIKKSSSKSLMVWRMESEPRKQKRLKNCKLAIRQKFFVFKKDQVLKNSPKHL
ncbi:URF1 [Bovine atadenovirus D]|uniref:URF1 n=1 Tax=Bovine adenovirus 4 TaxID=70333 RepID=Q997G5_ADEB4|nr:URF1 [Bovine atadenovirus D]AAK13191.1 URF1 [Bovine adenovirus 4]